MANTYDISTYIQALETAKAAFAAASKGVDVRESIVNQCEAIIDIAEQIIADLNDAVDMSFAVPDTTLTQQGKPAEAKATGDALATKADAEHLRADEAAIGNGCSTIPNSCAIGGGVISASANQLSVGYYNSPDTYSKYSFLVGNGNSDNDRNTCAAITRNGKGWFKDGVVVGGLDPSFGSQLATESWVSSQHYATYNALYSGLDGKVNTADVSNDISTDAASTTKVPSVKAIKDYVDGSVPSGLATVATTGDYGDLINKPTIPDVSNAISTDSASTTKVPSVKAIKDYVDSFTPSGIVDQTIVQNSTNAVSGGAVHTALAGKQDALTIDTELSNISPNPVKNSVIFTALSKKFDTLDVSNNMTTDGSSTTKVPCCKAIKKYVDDAIAAALANS